MPLAESAFEKSSMLPKSIKKILEKTWKRPALKAAIKQYLKFIAKGMDDGEAINKSAGIYGLESDKLFSDIIHDMRAKGMLEGAMPGELLLIMEEGEPTNTSEKVAPDRDHVTEPKTKKKKGKCDMEECKKFSEFVEEMNEATGPRMPASVKRKASNAISKIAKQNYFSSIASPVYDADAALRGFGYRLVQEDGTDYSAIYTGADGRASIRISALDSPDHPSSMVTNTSISLSWYKMPSGLWEVNIYMG